MNLFENLNTYKENTIPTLKPFEKTDWFGWGGANKFPDGSEPLIAHGEFATMIVGGGDTPEDDPIVYIDYGDPDEGTAHFATKGFETKDDAIRAGHKYIGLLNEPIDENELKALGFYSI